MKKFCFLSIIAIFTVSFSVSLLARNTAGPGTLMEQAIASLPVEELSEQEIEGLLLMVQEEKLARDVYSALAEQWGLPIFTNISKSEQQHMNAVKILLTKYSIEDPVSKDVPGKFEKEEFRTIYEDLVKTGSTSLVDALKMGATIEDLDIKDLQDLLKETDNQDIQLVYQNLMKGSRNHIRAFTKNLTRRGGEYQPQYISEDDYQAILEGPHERGMLDEKGE